MIYDRTQETTTTTGTGSLTLSGSAPAGLRTFAAAVAATYPKPVTYVVIDAARGQWECGIGSLISATTLTRGVKSSSNNNALVSFQAGEKLVFSAAIAFSYEQFVSLTSPIIATMAAPEEAHLLLEDGGFPRRIKAADFFAAFGQSVADLASAGALVDADLFQITQGGVDKRLTFANLCAAVAAKIGAGTAPPADTTAPTLSSATGAANGANAGTGSVSTNEANGTLYYLVSTASTATETAIRAGSSMAITSTGVKNVSAAGLLASTLYYLHFLHVDAAGLESNVISASFTTTASGAAAVTGLSLTGPTAGNVSVQSTDFTVGVTPTGGTLNASPITVTPSDNGAGGTFSPTSVQITDAIRTATFKYTPNATAGANSITLANNASLANPAAWTYTAAAVATPEIAYTYRPYSSSGVPNVIFDTFDGTTKSSTQGSLAGYSRSKWANTQYWNIIPPAGAAAPASAVFGWGTSPTEPPPIITASQNKGAAAVNGMNPMSHGAGNAWTFADHYMWHPVGIGTAPKMYPWIKAEGGPAVCLNTNGTIATGV